MPRKTKESTAGQRGKPRKYGPGSAGLCRHVGISMPAGLAERLESAADQINVSRSAIVVAAVEQILSQSPDRLAAQIASRTPAAE